MTEAEWQAATDPAPMLTFLRDKASDRKLRLFAAGCCRRVERYFIEPCQLAAVRALEGYADGDAPIASIHEVALLVGRLNATYFDEHHPGEEPAYRSACVVIQAVADRPLQQLCNREPPHWLDDVVWGTTSAAGYALAQAEERLADHGDDWQYHIDLSRGVDAENLALVAMVREHFGNPFRPITFDPSWRTEAVVALARGMYESRDFAPMQVLADAIEDAGCADTDILAHCRGPGPHVRGCWVVDLVLGKS